MPKQFRLLAHLAVGTQLISSSNEFVIILFFVTYQYCVWSLLKKKNYCLWSCYIRAADCDFNQIKEETVTHGRYLVVALLHLPCYALFTLVLRLKHSVLESWFPQTYVKWSEKAVVVVGCPYTAAPPAKWSGYSAYTLYTPQIHIVVQK
jgi:hypothetical protein